MHIYQFIVLDKFVLGSFFKSMVNNWISTLQDKRGEEVYLQVVYDIYLTEKKGTFLFNK